jgi:ribosomal protein S27AE
MVTEERIRFCTHCGTLFESEANELRPHRERVCARCGLGVLLATGRDMLSRDGQALLVVTGDVMVSAASEAAGELLELHPEQIVGRPLLSLLDSPIRGSELARRAARAAAGAGDISLLRVDVAGVTREVRLGRCGEPRGALLVFSNRD